MEGEHRIGVIFMVSPFLDATGGAGVVRRPDRATPDQLTVGSRMKLGEWPHGTQFRALASNDVGVDHDIGSDPPSYRSSTMRGTPRSAVPDDGRLLVRKLRRAIEQ